MRKFQQNILLVLFCSLTSLVWGQSANVLSGTWLGKLEQSSSGPFKEFRFRLELKQEGTKVTGMSYINLTETPEVHAKMRLEGRFDKGVLTFHELDMVAGRGTDGWDWCLKRAELTLKQVGEFRRLAGPWEGYVDDFPCAPGTITLEKLNPQPKTEIAAKPSEAMGDFGNLQGRKITHRKEIDVTLSQLTLYIWDGDKVDGDRISLQYNGQWLLQNYTISKTKKELKIAVLPGAENQLILYAENQGQYPPNTAAVTFFDGKVERNLSLSSDKETCGALKFVFVQD